MEDTSNNQIATYIGGITKVLKYYGEAKNTGVYDGLTSEEKQSAVKPVINKSLKDTRILGLSPLGYISISLGVVALLGIAVVTIKSN